MADAKITALTALATPATDDLFPIVDDVAGTPITKKVTLDNVDILFAGTTRTLTNKTIDEAVISGTPDAEGELGYDSTQKALSSYTNGQLGNASRVVAAGVGTQTLTNSTVADQDFSSLMTLPANAIVANKLFRITAMIEHVTGTSSVTVAYYLKLGATKVVTQTPATNLADNSTTSVFIQWLVIGRAAASAASAVSSMPLSTANLGTINHNTVNQPVNLATNGTLAVTFGITFSGTGSTENVELQGWMVEELN